MFWTWLTFSKQIIFLLFEKMLWGSRAIFFFETFRFTPRKTSRWKNSLVFSTTDVLFVPVSQLSTRDLFYFLENLKIKARHFCLVFLVSFDHSNNERYDSPIPDFLEQKCSRKCEFLSIWGVLQSQLWCPSWIFDTSLSERCLNGWLVKWKS